MAKNKDINISPSKRISIVIKNDIVQLGHQSEKETA